MKVLGILGSQARHGITGQLLQTVLDNVAPGVETETIFLEDYQIHPVAVQEHNDLAFLLKKLAESDVWIWAAPTYWRTINGILKKFLDCLRPELVYTKANGDTIPGQFKNKHYLSITDCYASSFENFVAGITDETFKAIDRVMTAAGVIRIGEIVCPGTLHLQQLPASKVKLCQRYGQKISHRPRKDDSTLKRYLQLFCMIALMSFLTMVIQQGLHSLWSISNFWFNYGSFVIIFCALLFALLHFVTFWKHRRR